MGFLGLGIVLLLVGILLIMLVTRMTARNLKLTLLAFIFIIAATAVIIFAIAGRYGLAAPAGALALGYARLFAGTANKGHCRRPRNQASKPCRAPRRWIFWGLKKAQAKMRLKRPIRADC